MSFRTCLLTSLVILTASPLFAQFRAPYRLGRPSTPGCCHQGFPRVPYHNGQPDLPGWYSGRGVHPQRSYPHYYSNQTPLGNQPPRPTPYSSYDCQGNCHYPSNRLVAPITPHQSAPLRDSHPDQYAPPPRKSVPDYSQNRSSSPLSYIALVTGEMITAIADLTQAAQSSQLQSIRTSHFMQDLKSLHFDVLNLRRGSDQSLPDQKIQSLLLSVNQSMYAIQERFPQGLHSGESRIDQPLQKLSLLVSNLNVRILANEKNFSPASHQRSPDSNTPSIHHEHDHERERPLVLPSDSDEHSHDHSHSHDAEDPTEQREIPLRQKQSPDRVVPKYKDPLEEDLLDHRSRLSPFGRNTDQKGTQKRTPSLYHDGSPQLPRRIPSPNMFPANPTKLPDRNRLPLGNHLPQQFRRGTNGSVSHGTYPIPIPEKMKGIQLLEHNLQQEALAQKICPVGKDLLGSMGKPFVTSISGRRVFVCCEGCVDVLKSNPEKYLEKLSDFLHRDR